MIPILYRDFIQKLITATEENEIEWDEEDNTTVVCRKKDSTITVSYIFDLERELTYYYFSYHNVNNDKKSGFKVSNEYEDFGVMERLFDTGKAKANDIENELSNFFDDEDE